MLTPSLRCRQTAARHILSALGHSDSVKQARDNYLGKLEKENREKLHEYDVATLNVWAAETTDEAKKLVEGLV